MNSRLLKAHAALDAESLAALKDAMERFDMSARAYDRILKVARTIADLDYAADTAMTPREAAAAPIRRHHIYEALSYRNLDRASWGTTFG